VSDYIIGFGVITDFGWKYYYILKFKYYFGALDVSGEILK
jgi:hypothetical protein